MPTYGLTVGKLYDAVVSNQYDFIDDNSMPRYYSKEALVGCFEVVEDDATTIKREGVVALLPEGSEFKIGQEVFVNMYLYKGVATIKGYDYSGSPDGYILETPEYIGATPHHNGLCKTGHALWAIERYVKAIVPTKAKKWGKWIENTTGEQPKGLDEDVKVKLHWNDGDVTKSTVGAACWYFSESVNITHYKVKKNKWTKNTGVIPVDCGVKIEVKLRGGIKEISQADDFYWSFEDEDTDIIKWRLAE
jgi:hypothetical protein